MALSIGPSEFRFGISSSRSQANQNNSVGSAQPVPLKLRTAQTGQSSSTAEETAASIPLSPRARAENRTSGALLNGSLEIALKEDATEKLVQTTQAIVAKAEALKKETNPLLKEKLQQDISDLLAEAQSMYQQAVAENPSIADNVVITALVKPGAREEDAQKYFSTTVVGASSPEELGLTGLSFADADLEDTIEELGRIEVTLENKLSSYGSSNTDIASVVRERGTQAAAQEKVANDVAAEKEALAVADKIRGTMNLDAVPTVEQLHVETLLASEEKQKAEEAQQEEKADEQPAMKPSADQFAAQQAQMDPAKDPNVIVKAIIG